MPTLKIGRRALATIGAVEKPTTFYDEALKGFGLLVRPSGARSWIVEYRPGAGGRGVAKRRVVLGPCDETMSPETARDAAKVMLARVRMGADPAGERSEERSAATIKEIANQFMARHVRPKRKEATRAFYQHILDTHILPSLGTKQAIKVTKSDVARLHHDLAEKRASTGSVANGPKTRGGRYIANRTISVIAAMYGWAAGAGLTSEGFNPAKGLEKYKEERRERFLSTEEITKLGEALREAEGAGLLWAVDEVKPTAKHAPKAENRRIVLSAFVTAAIRLLMFTGCRLREILHLEWKMVDLERGLLFLADSKTGRKTVVLSAPALAVLASLERPGRYVIASESAGLKDERPRRDLKRPWAAVSKHAGLAGVRIHDLRHTFASFGAGLGLGLPVIGGLLGHTQARTTQRYAHLAVDPLRRAADVIAGQIAGALASSRR